MERAIHKRQQGQERHVALRRQDVHERLIVLKLLAVLRLSDSNQWLSFYDEPGVREWLAADKWLAVDRRLAVAFYLRLLAALARLGTDCNCSLRRRDSEYLTRCGIPLGGVGRTEGGVPMEGVGRLVVG